MGKCTILLLLLVGNVCGLVLGNSSSNNSANVGTVTELYDESDFGVNTTVAANNESALVKAARYLMKQRNADSWGAFTPRAVVAMSFASRVLPDAVNGKELMEKQLDVQLLLDLMQNQGNMSLSKLALYINALYATCEDPRYFKGLDLVARLRSYTNKAVASDSSIPLAFLTLCLAGELTRNDAKAMTELYNKEFERMSSKALTVMSMICYMNKNPGNSFANYVSNFFSLTQSQADVYTKALFMQASLAAGRPIVLQNLLSEQLPDGSFGDMLSTYYAIPVLMNSSLLDLKCSSALTTGMSLGNLRAEGNGDEHHVAYSLWISTDTDKEVNSHQLTVTYDGTKSFFDVMRMAAARDPLFRFLFDEANDEKKVYSIGGIPNDSESRKRWLLYSGTINKVELNSKKGLKLETNGVNKIFPKKESHYVFWLKRGHV